MFWQRDGIAIEFEMLLKDNFEVERPTHWVHDCLKKRNIKLGNFNFDGKIAEHNISEDAKNFIDSLIQPDPDLRMTLQEAVSHPWFDELSLPNSPLLYKKQSLDASAVFLRLAEFRSTKKL